MPFFKAFKNKFTGSNKKYITKDKVYQIIIFDFHDDGYEFALTDDLGEELWISDSGDFDYRNTFHKVKLLKVEYKNGEIIRL